MKKILVISTIPTPPVCAGNSKCILEYCDLLKRIECEVHFLFIEGKNPAPKELKNYWKDRVHVYKKKIWLELFKRIFVTVRSKILGYNHVDDFYPIGLTKYVKKIQDRDRFDGIIINYITLSQLFTADLQCKKILFAHDCMSFKKLRLNVDSFWFDLTPNQEAKGLQRSDIILSIQENETTLFKYLHPKGTVLTVYSYFKIKKQPITGNKNILFLSGKSALNVTGIKYFIESIFPLVLREQPDARLVIGGTICEVLPIVNNKNIVLMGRIDDAEQFYAMGDIAINPVYQGTGLKIKTFEALSYGKTTIVHPHSAEGIYNPTDAPIMQGKNTVEFANKIIEALSNVEQRMTYSNNAIEYMQLLNRYIESQYKQIVP